MDDATKNKSKTDWRVNNKKWGRGMAGYWQRKTSSSSSHDPRSSPAPSPSPSPLYMAPSHILPSGGCLISYAQGVCLVEEMEFQVAKWLESHRTWPELGQELSYCQFAGPNWSNYCSSRGVGVGADFRSSCVGQGITQNRVAKSIRYASSCHLQVATCNMLRKQRAKLICCRLSVNCQSTTGAKIQKKGGGHRHELTVTRAAGKSGPPVCQVGVAAGTHIGPQCGSNYERTCANALKTHKFLMMIYGRLGISGARLSN